MGTHPIFESDFDCLTDVQQRNMIPVIAVIGGTGLENPEVMKDQKELEVQTTPWGEASTIRTGTVGGIKIFILSRHGKNHDKSPTQVNYCANIWALKQHGVTHIVATTACGSLKEEYRPGDLVVLDDHIDMTKYRVNTHVGNAVENGGPRGIMHLPSKPAFDEKLRQLIIDSMTETGVSHHTRGTTVTIEGPRFSTLAESRLFSGIFGAEIVNMTTCPEATIAKEMGIHYASIAMITDYDCWKENEEVSVENVMKQMKLNAVPTLKVLLSAIPRISNSNWDKEHETLLNICKG